MSGLLSIDKGSPNWWLSPDIWITLVGDPTTPPGVAIPIAGKTYNVSVRIHDIFDEPVDSGWNLFVCWTFPTAGGTMVTVTSTGLTINHGEILSDAPIGVTVPATSSVVLTPTTWTPTIANGGHECLIAMAYNEQAIGFPFSTLNGDAPDTDTYSIAQHNLGVLPATQIKGPFHYAFQVCNGGDEEGRFVVEARQAPLSEIAAFLPGVPGGRKLIDKPGKVEQLGIVESTHRDNAALEDATAILSHVELAPRSCRQFTLTGVLQKGNALINVTQSLNERVVGGLSVLVMAEE